MNIRARTSKLAKLIASEQKLRRVYGPKSAKVIMGRVSVLKAAMSLDEVPHLPPFYREELKGADKGTFSVRLPGGLRLVFEPNHNPVPRKEDGGIDLAHVTAITVLRIEDYHR